MEDAPQADPLPQNLKAGLLYKVPLRDGSQINVALDLTQPAQSEMGYNAGLEYWYHSFLALREGYLKEEGNIEDLSPRSRSESRKLYH